MIRTSHGTIGVFGGSIHLSAFLCVCLLFFVTTGVQAQAPTPVLFTAQGDLWGWSEGSAAPERWTQNGTLSGVALSPDNTRIAFHTLAPLSRAGLDTLQVDGSIAEYDLPGDIALLDITTRAMTAFAAQNPDATLTAGSSLVRSYPAWSPNGDALAWVEFPFLSIQAQVVAQSLSEMDRRVVADVILLNNRAPDVRWGRGGFALRLSTQANGEQVFALYRSDGNPLPTLRVLPASNEFVQLYDWVKAGESDLLGVLFSSGRWALFDAQTGTEQATQSVPMLYSISALDAPALRFGVTPEGGFFWETVTAQTQTASIAFPGVPGQVSLAPNANDVVFSGYPEFGALAIARDGSMISIAGTGSSLAESVTVAGVWWSAMEWRLTQPDF